MSIVESKHILFKRSEGNGGASRKKPNEQAVWRDGLNHKVIAKLDNVVRDTIKFEKAMDILKDMTKLMEKIIKEIF